MNVKCFLLEPTGKTWWSDDRVYYAPIYRRADTGEEMTFRDAPPGAMVEWERMGLVVKLPNGRTWHIDSEASNCTRKGDKSHRCWIRHGTPPLITVDKNGETCAAGAGSIMAGDYHGFLRNGVLEQC